MAKVAAARTLPEERQIEAELADDDDPEQINVANLQDIGTFIRSLDYTPKSPEAVALKAVQSEDLKYVGIAAKHLTASNALGADLRSKYHLTVNGLLRYASDIRAAANKKAAEELTAPAAGEIVEARKASKAKPLIEKKGQ